MSARSVVLTVMVLMITVIYGCFFTGWFGSHPIQIMVSRRPGQPLQAARDPTIPPVDQVTFGFDTEYELNSVKVVRADELAAGQAPYAFWHLVGDRRSKPVRAITYGQHIEGMRPYSPGLEPDPLEPGVEYVLQIEAHSGKIKAQTNFFTVPSSRRRR